MTWRICELLYLYSMPQPLTLFSVHAHAFSDTAQL